MASNPPIHSNSNEGRSHWLWPLLIFVISIALIGGLIYGQKVMQQVESIEQRQISRHETRDFLLIQPGVLNVNWMRTLNPLAKKIQGDIVWSNLMQQGMMRFANLPALPKGQQYHLWIYDLNKHVDDPISLVKFSPDLTLHSELLIPFTTSELIYEPHKFMIMLEYDDDSIMPEPLLLAQP